MNRSTANGNQSPRDAIVMSGWSWETSNVPERVALALAHLGAKVLYSQNPSSLLRSRAPEMEEVQRGIWRFVPQFVGHRLNRLVPGFEQAQARLVANQVLQAAAKLNLRDPLFVYPHGDFFVPLSREFKRRGFRLIHVCFDYPEDGQDRHIRLSDCTLTLSRTVFHQLQAEHGEKIELIPQVRWPTDVESRGSESVIHGELSAMPRPRLGYIGPVSNRLNFPVLERLLRSRPDWHFVHFGDSKCLPLPNVHAISWSDPAKLDSIVARLDVGFMPYNCYSNKDFHCMPLKVFDYFHAGIPVVSTPIVNLWEYADTIYFGNTADELTAAIQLALDEPLDSPLRAMRTGIARRQSIEALAGALATILFPGQSSVSSLSEEGTQAESVGLRNE